MVSILVEMQLAPGSTIFHHPETFNLIACGNTILLSLPIGFVGNLTDAP